MGELLLEENPGEIPVFPGWAGGEEAKKGIFFLLLELWLSSCWGRGAKLRADVHTSGMISRGGASCVHLSLLPALPAPRGRVSTVFLGAHEVCSVCRRISGSLSHPEITAEQKEACRTLVCQTPSGVVQPTVWLDRPVLLCGAEKNNFKGHCAGTSFSDYFRGLEGPRS